MEKIDFLNLRRLRNNEHFEFMNALILLVIKYKEAELPFGTDFPKFQTAVNEEQVPMQVLPGSLKSAELDAFDDQRDRTIRALLGRVKATVLSPVKEEAESAVVIKRIFDKFGRVDRLGYLEESSALKNLIPVLLSPSNEMHLATIGIRVWVEELQKQSNGFDLKMNDRNEEYANKVDGDVEIKREVVDPLYEKLLARLHGVFALEMATPAAVKFSKELQEKVEYFNRILAKRTGKTNDNEV